MPNPTLKECGAALAEMLGELENVIERAKEQIAKKVAANDELKEPFIGKRDAAEFLNMSVSTLELRMASKYGPPRYTEGGKVNFLRSELRAWRAQWRVN